MRGEFFAANPRHPFQALRTAGRAAERPDIPAVVGERKCHIEARQCHALQHAHDVLVFGVLGAQELAPRGNIEEKIPNLDARSQAVCGRRRRADLAVSRFHSPGMRGLRGARRQRQSGNGGDARQRFAAKAQGGDVFQVLEAGNLAGGMARQRQCHVGRIDADAIVETRIKPKPPRSSSTSMRRAPASSAFSTSSLTTEAGRSITSPAAI